MAALRDFWFFAWARPPFCFSHTIHGFLVTHFSLLKYQNSARPSKPFLFYTQQSSLFAAVAVEIKNKSCCMTVGEPWKDCIW